MSTVRKSYTEEFKREAVRLAKERGGLVWRPRQAGGVSDGRLFVAFVTGNPAFMYLAGEDG